MMNQVKSEFDGKVIAINIEDGDPVEFGQELISIEKSKKYLLLTGVL